MKAGSFEIGFSTGTTNGEIDNKGNRVGQDVGNGTEGLSGILSGSVAVHVDRQVAFFIVVVVVVVVITILLYDFKRNGTGKLLRGSNYKVTLEVGVWMVLG